MTALARRFCQAADGVSIAYSAAGSGDPALVFVHAGLANRSFWNAQLQAFAPRCRVVALDLPGHGESGRDRLKWGVPEFGGDVEAVMEAEKLGAAIIVGNSLGGPVAVEAAIRRPHDVLGVIGVDTFQRVSYTVSLEHARQRADAFRENFAGSVEQMLTTLFHADADAALVADVRRQMMEVPVAVVHAMFLSMGGYDLAAAVRRLKPPLRAINGDLYPSDVEAVREVKNDFDVVVMTHAGHFPMLERPTEFDAHLSHVVSALTPSRDQPLTGP